MHAVQPKHLRITSRSGSLLCQNGSCIVAAAFGEACAANNRTHQLILNHNFYRVHTLSIIIARGRKHNHKLVSAGRVNAHAQLCGKEKRTDVKRSFRQMRHPILLVLHKLLHIVNIIILRYLRNTQTRIGIVMPLGIHIRPEKHNFAVCVAISLHTLKSFLSIMEHHHSRLHRNGAIWNDGGIMPANTLGIIHHKHMVGKIIAKAQLILIRFGLWVGIGDYFNFLHKQHSYQV